MKLALANTLVTVVVIAFCGSARSADVIETPEASEAVRDCEAVQEAFVMAIEEDRDALLPIFIEALRADPQCRRSLLMIAAEAAAEDRGLLEKVIYVAREEFPEEASVLAEAALLAAPGASDIVRDAFFASEETRQSALALAARSQHPGLVALPAEAILIDEDIRDAIARIAAKVEGKLWLEQEVEPEQFRFRAPDEVRVPRRSRLVDEASLENGLPVVIPELAWSPEGEVLIDDLWEPSDSIRLDESRFAAAAPGPEEGELGEEEPNLGNEEAGVRRALDAEVGEWEFSGFVGEIQMGAQVAGEDFVPVEGIRFQGEQSVGAPGEGGADAILQMKIDSLLAAPQP